MRPSLIALIFLCLSIVSNAQKETSHWFLSGSRVSVTPGGITNTTPTGMSFDFYPRNGSTSVADATGNLLFASDGRTVIDKNLSVMQGLNGTSLQGTDKVLAAKIPNSSRYYVFYAHPNDYSSNASWTLQYAVVDISLNGGLGNVIAYNQIIDTALSQGFTLAQGNGTEDVWLVTHRKSTTDFLCYKITAAGLSTTPVISHAGTVQTTIDYIFKELKTSHDGKMIAGIAYRVYPSYFAETYQFLEVFNFNALTGEVSNKVRTTRGYGYFYTYQSVEFSPDNRLLYGGYMQRIDGLQPCGFGAGTVIQYNLCYTDSIEFTKNSMVVATNFAWCSPNVSWRRIQLGADKKIYMPYTGTTISRINNPNRIGSSCTYQFNAHQVETSNYATIATPTFHHRALEKATKNNIVYSGGCFPNPLSFTITNDTIASVLWNFGDPSSSSNTSTLTTPQHTFSTPGFYTVTAQLFNSSGGLMETLSEWIEIKDPTKRLLAAYPKDTSFCYRNSLKLKLNVVNGIFRWLQRSPLDGSFYQLSTGDSLEVYSTGTYYVEMRQNDCTGCVMMDSIRVMVLPVPDVGLGYDRNLCAGDSLQLSVYDPAADYIWSTGDTTTTIWAHQGGTYWVQGEIDHNGCAQRDTIIITAVPGVQFSLPKDTTLCNNATLLLSPGVTNTTYLWQDGSSQTSYMVTQPGSYWVRVTSPNLCRRSDTIQVSYVNAQQVSLGKDTTFCQGDSLVLHTRIANARYLWSNGATDDSITVKQSGVYWVRVDNGNCTVSDSITVTFATPPAVYLGNDTMLCEGQRLLLHANVSNASYLWSGGSVADSLMVTQPGVYGLQVNRNGCTVKDTIAISYKSLPVLNLGNDTSICVNNSLLLDATHPSIQRYIWQNGSTQSGFTIQNAGTYWVKAIGMNGCSNSDTIRVATRPLPFFSLGNDTTLCMGQTISYTLSLPNASYLWSNSKTYNSFTVSQEGTYWLTVTQNDCSKSDSITVLYRPLPQVTLGNDTTLCEGQALVVEAFNPNATYNWNTGATAAGITINKPGRYSVAVNVDNCVNKDTIDVFYTSLPHFSLGADTLLCNGQSFVLSPKVSNAYYLWQDGSVAPTFTVTQPGTYSVIIRNDCGSLSDEITVVKGLCQLYMPNAFTPNRDGLNDVFKVKYPQFIKTFRMQVFNRWGQVVFSTTNPYEGWNGKYKDADMDTGNYIWLISLVDLDGNAGTYKGSVMLIH